MKTPCVALLVLLLATLSASAPAQRYRDGDDQRRTRARYAYAQVIDVRPVYERMSGGECWEEPVALPPPRPLGKPEIVGGVIGGVVGAGAIPTRSAAAAALNAALAQQSEQRVRALETSRQVRYERHCDDGADAQRTELVGFDVTYDYDGDVGHMFSEDEPGDEVRVRIR